MKLVVFSDLHLDAQFSAMGLSAAPANKRRQAIRDALEQIVRLAQDVHADAVLCGGDLYEEERCTPDTAAFLQRTFERVQPLPIYIAPGNHDWLGPQSVYRRVQWSDNVHIFCNSRLTPVRLSQQLTLWGAAHLVPANTPNFLDRFHVEGPGTHIALFHGAEQNVVLDEGEHAAHAPFRADQIKQAGLAHAFLGHYHRPRDAERLTYPGNPAPLTFGETGERGPVIVTINDAGQIHRERRPVYTVGVHDCQLDVTGVTNVQEVRTHVRTTVGGLSGYVRVTLSGELPPDVELRPGDLVDIAPSLDALVIRKGQLRVAYDVEAIGKEPTVRGAFVRTVGAAPDLSDEQRQRVIITGLRALAGRDDLEVW